MRVGIDLMGGDKSPQVLYEGVLKAAELLDSSSTFVLFATDPIIQDLSHFRSPSVSRQTARIEFHAATDIIAMNDEPLSAIRLKKNSSLVMGIRLLKKRLIEAFVSAGNTGALLASASLCLPMLPGIHRPALLAILPTQTGCVAVIDVGGNVSCRAHHLFQFAHLGAAYQRCCHGVDFPRVGLLNIGVESKKGTLELRQAYQMLEEIGHNGNHALQFAGNVEGRGVFRGDVDVLVTDGFTGNVLLKTSEGLSSFIFHRLQDSFRDAGPHPVQDALSDLQKHFHYAEYPGAILCGIDGVIVKCHGHSSAKAMFNGVKGAIALIQKKFINEIKNHLLQR